jgi:hypothetical protein
LLKQKRELDDAKRELDLTVEKRVSEGLTATRQQARKEAEDELKLKVSEKEQTISSMQKQIEDLKRRAEQGSQQLQGEVQELELETLLKAKFPHDTIAPVPKGEHGGDVLQRVVSRSVRPAEQFFGNPSAPKIGATAGWQNSATTSGRPRQKLPSSSARCFPKALKPSAWSKAYGLHCRRRHLPVAVALRYTLIETATARVASEGQQTKTELVYQYLTGPRFRQRVQAIVEAFGSMKEDLDKEKKAILKQWAKREEQIERVMQSTVGMYGDLQGIAGKDNSGN